MKKALSAAKTQPVKAAKVDDRQLVEAIVLSLVQYRAACRRFNARRKLCGFDHVCRKLLDQIALRKSLLRLLVAEARSGGRTMAA
jgi:hypothetical protein